MFGGGTEEVEGNYSDELEFVNEADEYKQDDVGEHEQQQQNEDGYDDDGEDDAVLKRPAAKKPAASITRDPQMGRRFNDLLRQGTLPEAPKEQYEAALAKRADG